MNGSENLVRYEVIKSAKNGDAEAIDIIKKKYKGYINKLSTIKIVDDSGYSRSVIDYYLAETLEEHLVISIFKFRSIL
ncbi:MAG: helix-turn-helix domain-containing protein [Anaerovoracaceae bacterium]